jgi:5'-3' exonuclease
VNRGSSAGENRQNVSTIRGVGPVYAKKLVRVFGEKVFDVIQASPDRLREVAGMGAGSRCQHSCRVGRAEGGPGNHGLPAEHHLISKAAKTALEIGT